MEELKRVLLFDPYFSGKYGNARYVIDLFQHEKDLNVNLFTSSTEEPVYLNDLPNSKKKYFKLKLKDKESGLNKFGGEITKKNLFSKLSLLSKIFSYSLRFRTLCVNNKIDIVHCNSIRGILTIGLGAKLAGCKTILYIKSNLSSFVYCLPAFILANRVLFQTETNKGKTPFILKLIFKKKFKILKNAIDLSRLESSSLGLNYRKELNLDESSINFIYMGSITHRKGIHVLLRAIGKLEKKKKINLFLLGDHSLDKNYFEELKKIIAVQKISKKINFLGHKEDALDVLNVMDCLILPSLDEGLPKCVIEAKCLGKPSIVTDTGGTKEIMEDKKDGYVVPAGNVKALLKAMESYIENSNLINNFANNNKKISRDKFSFKNHCQELSRIYLSLLK